MGGWDQLRARLVGDGEGRPMIVTFSTCVDSIRTIPFLQHDPDRAEDIMTDSEDHAADEWRYACMSRPYVPTIEKPKPKDVSSGYRPWRNTEDLLMVYCRIAALPTRYPDALHDDVMNFAALFEVGFKQRCINRLGQVDARMHDIRPWPSFGRLLRRLSTRRGVAALGQSLRSHGLPSPFAGYPSNNRAVTR